MTGTYAGIAGYAYRIRERAAPSWMTAVACAAGIVFLSAMLTAWSAPLFDPDEGYYPGTAAESVDAGRGWDLRFNGAPRWDKPVLTYLLIEASFMVFGRSVPAARLPIALQGATLVLIVGFVVYRVAGPRAARLSAFVLATTIGIQVFSRVAHPELGVVMAITTVELMAVLWLTSHSSREKTTAAAVAGVLLGMGVLTKGPVAIALPVLALVPVRLALSGARLPSRRTLLDLALAAAIAFVIAAPWYAAMTHRHGAAFLEEAVWRQNVSRFAGTAFEHESSPWFFVIPALVAMFPWTAFVPAAMQTVNLSPRHARDVLKLCMASAAVTAFVFYSVSLSKLASYILVVVPSLAILVALRLDERDDRDHTVRRAFVASAILLALTAVLCASVPFLLNRGIRARDLLNALPGTDSQLPSTFAMAVWPAAAVLGAAAIAIVTPGSRARIAVLGIAGAVLPPLLIFSGAPLLREAYPWSRFASRIRESRAPVWLIGPRAPSLTFYARRPVVRVSEGEAEPVMSIDDEAWILAPTDWLSRQKAPQYDTDRFQVVDRAGSMSLVRVRASRDANTAR